MKTKKEFLFLHLLVSQTKSVMKIVSQRETLNQLKPHHGLLK